MAAPPPPSTCSEDRSYSESLGLERKSTIIVVIADQFVTFARSICSAAQSRSQRDRITIVAARWIGAFMPACMPVTWNIGSAQSTTAPSCAPRQFR